LHGKKVSSEQDLQTLCDLQNRAIGLGLKVFSPKKW
ncbi:unnamed protein product, partial [marine sediment metagenome]